MVEDLWNWRSVDSESVALLGCRIAARPSSWSLDAAGSRRRAAPRRPKIDAARASSWALAPETAAAPPPRARAAPTTRPNRVVNTSVVKLTKITIYSLTVVLSFCSGLVPGKM